MKNDLGVDLPQLKNAPLESNSFLRWMWFFIKDKKVLFFGTSLARMIFSILEVSQIYVTGQIINGLVQGNDIYGIHAAFFWLLMFFVLYGVYVFLLIFLKHIGIMRSYVEKRFSLTALEHFFKLSMNFHENIETGGLLQKFIQARSAIHSIFYIYYFNIITFIGSMIGSFILLYTSSLSYDYYLLFTLYGVVYAIYTTFMIQRLGDKAEEHSESREKVVAGVYEFLNHIRLVKTHCLQHVFQKKGLDLEFKQYSDFVDLSSWRTWMWFGNCAIAVVFSAIIMYVGVKDAIDGVILVGTFAIIAQLTWAIWGFLEEIVTIFSEAAEHKISIMRAVDVLKQKTEIVNLLPEQKMPEKWKEIQVNNISYAYDDDEDQTALTDITMSIKRGEHIGLVGYSGSGKSTFVKLLMKMMLPKTGEILLDGYNLSHIQRDEYLSSVSFVPQDVDLFNDTARENIVVGKDVSEDQLVEVLRLSYVDEFIDQLADGLDTKVGERGVKLSGGQRQRVGIARAIAKDGDIVIFDEATSALDSVSEHYIQESLKSSFDGKTLVVIAHRLATIAHLDKIYVFDKGRIVEAGSHEHLIENNGVYARMWTLQSNGFLNEDG